MHKLIVVFSFFIFCNFSISAQSFEKYYGDTTANEKGRDLIQWEDGSIYVVGYKYIEASFNYDITLYKIRQNGILDWTKTFNFPFSNYAYNIIRTHDDKILLCGETENAISGDKDIFLIKVDTAGNLLTQKNIGTSSKVESLSRIRLTKDSLYVGCGFISDALGSNNTYIIKLDQSLNMINSVEFGIPGANEVADDVTITSDNKYFISTHQAPVGSFQSDFKGVMLDSSLQLIWETVYGLEFAEGCQSAIETSNGNFLMVGEGYYDHVDYKYQCLFFILSASGDTVSFTRLGLIPHSEVAFGVIEDNDGGFIVVGYAKYETAIPQKMFVFKFQNDTINNMQYFGGPGIGLAYSIIKEKDDGWLIAGFSNYLFGAGDSKDKVVVKHVLKNEYPTSISESKENIKFTIAPNPAMNTLYLLNIELSPQDRYEISNLQGQVMQSGRFQNTQIDISQLASGQQYILSIQSKSGKKFSQTFIKNL